VTDLLRSEALAATRIVVRPLANPLSLGFLGLTFATVMSSSLELGWVPQSESHTLGLGILAFTVTVQLVSCVFGFLTRDMVAASGMGVLAGTWAAVALAMITSPPGSATPAVGMFYAVGATAILMPAVAAAEAKRLAAAVNVGTALRWGLSSVYQFSASPLWKEASGVAGVVLAVLALYASLAFELEDQSRRTVLPTLRRGEGLTAMTGSLGAQVEHAAHEAGVRKQI
jgi:succinate-acetate transporter protein